MKAFLRTRFPNFYRWLHKVRNFSAPVPISIWLVNVIFQRILGVNRATPWMVHYTSSVVAPGKIRIGREVWVSFATSGGCYIQGGNGIIIGDGAMFAPGVKIISANHDPANLDRWQAGEPVVIGPNCWIGANAVILPGAALGDGCVVAAGAVVTGRFGPGSVVGGVPARLIKTRPLGETPVSAPEGMKADWV